MFRSVIVQFSGIVGGRLVAATAQALTIVMLARWSEPAIFGLVISVQTVLTALTVLISLGVPQYTGVARAQNTQSPSISALLRLNYRNSILASATFFVVLGIAGLIDPIFLYFMPLGVTLGLQMQSGAWDAIVVADRQIGLFSSNLIFRRTFGLALFTLLHMVQVHVVLAYCIAALLSDLLYITRMRRRSLFTPDKGARCDGRSVFSASKHFWVDAMSGQLRLLDVAATGLVLGPVASGYLAVPSRIASPMMLVPSSFATLLLPRVSASGGRTARRALQLAIGVATLIAAILTLLAWFLPALVPHVLGSDYLPAVPVTRIYFAGMVFLSLIYMLGAILQGLGLQSAVGRNSLVFSVLSVGLLIIGGYFYGLEAAAAGYVLATLGQLLGLVYLHLFRYHGAGKHIVSKSAPTPRRMLVARL